MGEHRRSFGRGETIYGPWHYVQVLARKPCALRNGAPFKNWVLAPITSDVKLASVTLTVDMSHSRELVRGTIPGA